MNVLLCQKSSDGIQELVAWFDTIIGYFEPCKGDCILSELKFHWMEGDAIVSTQIQPVHCVEKNCFLNYLTIVVYRQYI